MAYEELTCDEAGIGLESLIRGAIVKNDDGSFAMKTYPGYLSYVALVSQSGTSAPTAVVLSNNTGLTPAFTYEGTGSYTMSGPWPSGTAFQQVISTANGDFGILVLGQSGSDITMGAFLHAAPNSQSDDLLTDVLLEIRIYT